MKKTTSFFPVSLLLLGAGYILGAITRRAEEDPGSYMPKGFNSKAGEAINSKEAGKQTKKYRKDHKEKTVYANYCGRFAIEQILNNKACVGLRIYRAMSEKGDYGIVVVGVNSAGKDITEGIVTTQSLLIAVSYDKCESDCDNGSVLMQ
ncbi:hypothetical protein [uncultured Hymenobacter sp.]|uniref:hypothetical protein n=1 Tax=uncultured Hymenobacter sp. TaxID=170016 RepID=UPI0035CB71C3